MQKSVTFIKVSAAISGLAFSASAFAAGFQINEVSPTIQATALADAATASGDLSGMAFNPATLATIDSPDVYAAASVIIPHISYNNATSSLPIGNPGTVTSENNISPTAFVPAGYFGAPMPGALHNLHAGIGIDVPFGLETNYNRNWVGQFNALESKIQVLNIFPTLAYEITPKLDVGASINVEHISATYSNAFDTIGDAQIGNGLSTLTGSAWGMGYSVGVMFKPTSTTTLGADYHSTVRESINGTATISESTGLALPDGQHPGSVVIKLPATVNLGISQMITQRLTLMAGAEWTQWDSIPSIDANIQGLLLPGITTPDNSTLNYHNTWLFSIGGSYLITPKLKAMAGLAYDQTPTNNEYRDARIPGTNRKWLTMGLAYNMTKNFSVFGTYEHIFMNNQSINSTEQGPSIDGVPLSPSQVSADYSGYANIVAAGLNYKF